MSKAPFPEQDPLIALEKAIQLRDAKAVNQWFMEQKEIPASLQIATSSEMPESKYKGWEPLAGTFLRLVQHGESDPPILSYFHLKTYLEGTLFAIQAILSHSDTLTSVENQQKLFHLTQLYGHAIFFSSCDQVTYEILGTWRPINDQNRPSHTYKVALQQAAELLLKNEKDLKTFLKVSSPIFLSYLLRHLIDMGQTDAFSRLLQHGLSAHYLLRTQPIHCPQNSLSLLEYAIQEGRFRIALKLLQEGAHFDLPDPDNVVQVRLLVCMEVLELEVIETEATAETIQSAPLLEEEKSVNNSVRQKIINHGAILLSRCLRHATDQELLTRCLKQGIYPTSQHREQLIQYGIDNSLSATYFFNIFIFESPQEWEKRAEVLTEHSNSEVRRNMFLGLLLAYEKSLSQVPQGVSDSKTEDLNTCRQALIRHAKMDKDNSRRLMRDFFTPSHYPVLDLLVEGCGRLSTAKDFKQLFIPKAQNMPVFSTCSPKKLSLFILQAVSLDENNYQSFVEAAVRNDLETFFKALKLLQQQSNVLGSQAPLEPELIEKMFKAIGSHKKKCGKFLLSLIRDNHPQEAIFYFIDQTGYQPTLDHPQLLNLFKKLRNNQLLPLFPEILPETADTFAPLVEVASNSPDQKTRAIHFQKYVKLTYDLAARPGGDPSTKKSVEEILKEVTVLPSTLHTIITDYLPQKGDFPGSIWPQFQVQLSLPTNKRHEHVLSLDDYTPRSHLSNIFSSHETAEFPAFQIFLSHFGGYFLPQDYANTLADNWRAQPPWLIPLLYHRTVTMTDEKRVEPYIRDFDPPEKYNEEEQFLWYSGLTRRLPTETSIWTYRRPLFSLQQTSQIVFELGFQDRAKLTEQQLSVLCTHADAHPVQLLFDAAQREDTALLDFLVGNRKERKGIGLNINRQRTLGWDSTSKESSALMVAIKDDNHTVITRFLLRKAGFPKTTKEDFDDSSRFLSQKNYFSIYVHAIVAARKEAANTADPALAAHLIKISVDAVRVSITTEIDVDQEEDHHKKLWEISENQVALNNLMQSPGFKQELILSKCPFYSEDEDFPIREYPLLEIAIKSQCHTSIAVLRELIYQEAGAIIAASVSNDGNEEANLGDINLTLERGTMKDHPRFLLFEQLIDLFNYDLQDEKSPYSTEENRQKSWIRIRNYLKANPPELTRAFQTQIDKWPVAVAVADLALVPDQTVTVSEVPAKVQNSRIPAQLDEETKSRESTEISIISASNQTSISSSTRDESSRFSQETTPTDNKDAKETQFLVMREGNSELEVKEQDSKAIIESKTPDNNEAAKDSTTSLSSLKSDCIQSTTLQSSSLVDKIPTTDIKSTETLPTPAQPWWKSWWLLPMLGLAEGFDLGERWLLPSIENTTMSLWALQVISTVPPAVGGFFFGLVVYWGAINYGASLKGKLPSFLTSSSVLIGLLAAGLLGTPIAVECIPLFLDKWPVLQGYSRYAFAAMVLITGVLVGLLTQLGKSVYHSRWAGTLFHHPNSETVSATPNTPLLGSAFQSQS